MLRKNDFFEKQPTKRRLNEFPKVELHVHLEGTISPFLIEKLSKKYNIPIPPDLISSDGKQILWNGFEDFLAKYDEATRLICCKEAITQVTYEYLKQSTRDGSIYVELTVSPDHMAQHGISYIDTIDAVASGIKKAKQDFDIEARILIVLVRHLGVKRCEDLIETVLSNPHEYVVGINLAGNEKLFPPKLFVKAFQKARNGNLKVTAHAGEWTDAKDVLDAIDLLGVTRIGHGIHVAFDEKAIKEIVKKEIHLELCPTSNHSLQVCQNYPTEFKHLSYPSHPLTILHKMGVRYSLNTDDPPFFNTTLLTEFAFAEKLLELAPKDILKITLRSIEDSFAPDSLKAELYKKVLDFSKKNDITLDLEETKDTPHFSMHAAK
jgi:adenosine deaminase